MKVGHHCALCGGLLTQAPPDNCINRQHRVDYEAFERTKSLFERTKSLFQQATSLFQQATSPTDKLTIEEVRRWCERRAKQLDAEYADLEQRRGDPRSLAGLDGQETAYRDLAEALAEGRLPE